MDSKLIAFLNSVDNGEGSLACVYHLLDTYYHGTVGKIGELNGEDDAVYEKSTFPEEFLLPVEDRDSGIGFALTHLLDEGYDVDGTDGYFNALMLAVGSGDAPMVHFLIKHGADVNSWPGKGEEPALGENNYYLDDIDIHYMDGCFANDKDIMYLEALHRTALALVESAHLGPYSGYSLKISEDGTVSLGPAQVLF